MNKQTQEALKMAIGEIQDLMQHIKDRQPDMLFTGTEYVIDACKEALATNEESSVVQPAQEPVAWIDEVNNTITTVQLMKYGWLGSDDRAIPDAWIKLYPHSTPDSTPAIEQALSNQEGNQQLAKLTRLEVIDNNGRAYVNMAIDKLEFSYQDEGRTLKIFTNGAGVLKNHG
jgi:hypothetical protein